MLIDIPEQASELLDKTFGKDLSRAALEGIAAEGYRSGKLSRFQVQNLLGFEDRWETEAWLGSRNIYMHYTLEDLEDDRKTLANLFPEKS